MLIDQEFLDLIKKDSLINEAQASILNVDKNNTSWQDRVLQEDISLENAALLLLLRGAFSQKDQKQIHENYILIKAFKEALGKKKVTKKTTEMSPSSNTLDIYCDGACSNNPGQAGSGLAVYQDNKEPVLFYGEYNKMGTNNTAELHALYKALLLAQESKAPTIRIFSDSKYSIDCIKTWAYSWKSKNWTKKTGEIKNLELIKLAHNLYDEIKNKITLQHVKAHCGIEGNELADRMAGYTILAKNKEYQEYSYKNVQEVLSLNNG